MHAVVNHLHLDIPVEDLAPALESEGAPILSSMQGFQHFYLIKEAEDRAVIVIVWDSADDALNGAKAFGPTWFAKNIAPHLASEQVRTVGRVLVERGT